MNCANFTKASLNNEYLEFVEGLRDSKLVVKDDEAIVLHGEKLPENITALLFYMYLFYYTIIIVSKIERSQIWRISKQIWQTFNWDVILSKTLNMGLNLTKNVSFQLTKYLKIWNCQPLKIQMFIYFLILFP